MCHFLRPIEESFIQKYFGLVGKLSQVHIGEYKNKANNKRKRRTVYFAIVVYKRAEDCQLVLREPRFLQAKVNQVTKKGGNVKFAANPFANEGDDEDDEENMDDEHKERMEEGGFTIV